METRICEAKRDWHVARARFRRERLRMINLARNEQERNLLKSKLKKVDQENNRLYNEIGKKHDDKIKHLRNKKMAKDKNVIPQPKTWDEKSNDWINLVATGDGREKEPEKITVPMKMNFQQPECLQSLLPYQL